jgi:hypothetical protein
MGSLIELRNTGKCSIKEKDKGKYSNRILSFQIKEIICTILRLKLV